MRRPAIIGAFSLISALVLGVALRFHTPTPSPVPATAAATPTLTRAEVLALADRYVTHEWTATPAHIFHGIDPDGIRVDTPDLLFQEPYNDRGWWVTGISVTLNPFQ